MVKLFKGALLCMMFLYGAGGAGAADVKKLRIGIEGAYPPFSSVNAKGELEGFDFDLSKALCRVMGVDYEMVVQDWDGLIPGLKAKKYDAIIASVNITKERLKYVDFTDRYYCTPARFVVRKDENFPLTKEGLRGKTIGVQRATTHENFIRDNFGDLVKVKVYPTLDEANMDLVSGRVDMVFADTVAMAVGFMRTDQGRAFKFHGPVYSDAKWFGNGIGIVVRKGEKELLEALNRAIKIIREDGTYERINDRYFDFDLYGGCSNM